MNVHSNTCPLSSYIILYHLISLTYTIRFHRPRHDVDAAADLRYDAIPGVMQRIRELEKRKREQLGPVPASHRLKLRS